jgi:hypothetical protein
MKTLKEKPKISPENYKTIIQGIELKSISLKECDAYLNADLNAPGDLKIGIKEEADYKLKEENLVHIFHRYTIDARKPNSKSRYIKLGIVFLIRITSEETFTDDFFEIYKQVSLHLNTWPYLREYVNQMTSRMSVPPITLPLFRIP